MKKRSAATPIIVIEWNGLTVDGQVCHDAAEMDELARELGRIAARRDLAAARACEAGHCLGSDAKISTISAKLIN